MEGVVTHDFRFRLEEPTKKENQQVTAACGISKKKKGALHHQSEHGSGVTQTLFYAYAIVGTWSSIY